LTGAALARRRPRDPTGRATSARMRTLTVLINTSRMTKGLVLIRAFHAAGHRVVVADTERYRWGGHRFSRAVSQFYLLPDPALSQARYSDALVAIAVRERVDLFVPVTSPVGAQIDAEVKARLSRHCRVLHFDPQLNATLDDKYAFAESARRAGLTVPETHLCSDPDQILRFVGTPGKSYIIKPSLYDPIGRQAKYRLPLADPAAAAADIRALAISAERPWVIQEFVRGREYCAHATVRGGRITVFVCTESSPYQLNYAHVDHPAIYRWLEGLVAALDITDGQLCCDFIEAADGRVYAIECNPRTHSAITAFYDNLGELAAAYLGERPAEAGPLTPRPDTRPTYWLAMELERLGKVRSLGQLRAWLGHLMRGKDAVFSWEDPLPFFALHHAQIPSLLVRNLRRSGRWTHIDWCIGKVVEPGGD
ncbi:MAG: ATP-grasp enzyme, partial [Myxococcota bacterium]